MSHGLPTNHRLGPIYRLTSGFAGLVLLAFGVIGYVSADGLPLFGVTTHEVLGMTTNGALSALSVLFGLILLGAALIGGNAGSSVNMTVGVLLLVSGLVNICVLRTPDVNVLSFTMTNVVFSFVVGAVVLTGGLYGRVAPAASPA